MKSHFILMSFLSKQELKGAVKTEMTTRKTESNRRNAQKSTGPRNTNSTRFNATKHGLLAQGITELDDPESFRALQIQLESELNPNGLLEKELVKQVVIGIIRARRSRLLEAEELTAQLNPPEKIYHPPLMKDPFEDISGREEIIDGGLPARMSTSSLDAITRTLLRYEVTNENKLNRSLKLLHQLQDRRIRKAQAGEESQSIRSTDDLASFGSEPSIGDKSAKARILE